MARHGSLRARPAELKPGTLRVISCRMDYLADVPGSVGEELEKSDAYIARYARGRDYHKVLRARLQKLCERIEAEVGPFGYRVFTDSAPVLEVELAVKAGIGWRGKHTLLLEPRRGLVVFPRRGVLRPAPARRRGAGESMRDLRALHRHLPDAGDPRSVPARCAPLHLVPHHRAQERDSGRAAPAHRQPRLRLRRLPARVSVEPVRAAKRRGRFQAEERPRSRARWSSSSPGPRPSSTSGCRARPSGASATSAGCATSRWGWATPPARRR